MKAPRVLMWVMVAVLVYLASSGPIWCVVRRMDTPIDWMRTLYAPMTICGDRVETLLERYISLWAPLLH